MWHQPYEGPMGHAPWWVPFQGIVPILLLIVLVAVVVWAVLRTTRQRPVTAMPAGAPRVDAALEHARMRYAQGEIDRDQFQRIAQDLSGAEPGGPAADPPSLEP
jgi:putative membrane protein